VPLGGRALLWQQLDPRLRTVELVVVEQASQLLLNYRLLWLQARGGPRVAFWGHGRSFAVDPTSPAERAKASISRRAHWWFAYTSRSADIVTDLGFDASRITVVNNSIDTTALKSQIAAVDHARLTLLREELGVGPGPIGLFLGTLRSDKGLLVLIEAGHRIHREQPGFQLLVVGGGPLEDDVRRWAAQLPWLHYLGARYGSDRAELLALADLVLLPGAVGLVVLDAIVGRFGS
jgi:L-malate glycosyltransferase